MKIRRPIFFFLLAVTVSLVSSSTTTLAQTLSDKSGNEYQVKVLKDNKKWVTANLTTNLPGSYCYENKEENCLRYGRLYTWESAKRVCASLGNGWGLPTTAEWQQLAAKTASGSKDEQQTREQAYSTLLEPGEVQFNALLGGGRDPDGAYARIDAHGFYWTITEHNSEMAWFANFAKGRRSLFHQPEGEKARAFSVRCVKSK